MSIILLAMLTPTALTALSNAATTISLRRPSDGVAPRLVRDPPAAAPVPPKPGRRGALLDLRV